MKDKITILFLLVIGIFLFGINNTFAVSGACSSHSGVNCSAGPDWDGSVICYDGWRDSSVSYASSVECMQCTPSYLYFNGCKNQYDLDRLLQQYASRGLTFSGMRQQAEMTCKEEIIEYEKLKLEYENCISSRQQIREQAMQQLLKQFLCPSNSSYDSSIGQCRCYGGYLVRGDSCVSGDSVCQLQITGSKYNSTKNVCECSPGYVLSDDRARCITKESWCFERIGPNAIFNQNINRCDCESGYIFDGVKCEKEIICPLNSIKSGNNCLCEGDYEWNLERTICIKKEIKVVPPEITSEPKSVEVKEVPKAKLIKVEEATRTIEIKSEEQVPKVSQENLQKEKGHQPIIDEQDRDPGTGIINKTFNRIKSFFRKLKFW